jgi:two-component sensor histidine kinase
MSNDPEERLRNLRDAIGAVIEILEGVKEQARGFVAKQVEAEKASAEAQLRLDYLKTQLAEQANELAAAEGRLAALRRDHDQLYLSWQAVNTNLAVIAYFRGLRDNWKPATRQNDEAGADRVGNRHEHHRHGANRG